MTGSVKASEVFFQLLWIQLILKFTVHSRMCFFMAKARSRFTFDKLQLLMLAVPSTSFLFCTIS
jgi:hypothetical protein